MQPQPVDREAQTPSPRTPRPTTRAVCRKIRMEGYHGERVEGEGWRVEGESCSPPVTHHPPPTTLRCIHRQQHGSESASHTGLPIAPARWATPVQGAITRSRFAITAAVSSQSPRRYSSPKSTSPGVSCPLSVVRCSDFWSDTNATPGTRNRAQSRPMPGDRRVSLVCDGLPAQARPMRRVFSCQFSVFS